MENLKIVIVGSARIAETTAKSNIPELENATHKVDRRNGVASPGIRSNQTVGNSSTLCVGRSLGGEIVTAG